MTAVLQVTDLCVDYGTGASSLLSRRSTFRAVHDVSFAIEPGETYGLVGESGSGKSTTAMAIARLVQSSSGAVVLGGTNLTKLSRRRMRRERHRVQVVFQDPYSSLDPSMLVADSIREPLGFVRSISRRERDRRVTELLEMVGLTAAHGQRYPYEFSGGQRQRIAIARALATNPELLICDEVVSALDVSTQSTVINLLEDLQSEFGTAYLFISHDLGIVRHIATRVGVMYLGQIVEEGPVDRVFDSPAHPYTEALISSIPKFDPDVEHQERGRVLRGDIPDPQNRPDGCSFNTRCRFAMDTCRTIEPADHSITGGGKASCHLHVEGPTLGGEPLHSMGEPSHRDGPDAAGPWLEASTTA